MIDHWRQGESLPFPFTPDAVRATTVSELLLHP